MTLNGMTMIRTDHSALHRFCDYFNVATAYHQEDIDRNASVGTKNIGISRMDSGNASYFCSFGVIHHALALERRNQAKPVKKVI